MWSDFYLNLPTNITQIFPGVMHRWQSAVRASLWAGPLALGLGSVGVAAQSSGGAPWAVSSPLLSPFAIAPLPVGQITPNGWLQGEMQALAEGLPGHEHEFYVFVNESRWLFPAGSNSGTDYSSINEGLPYWFNGLVPLAYTLNDAGLKAQVQQVANQTLSLQAADGWLGPELDDGSRNLWARMPYSLGLIQLAEADANWTPIVVDRLGKFMDLVHSYLQDNGKAFTDCPDNNNCQWGQSRVPDLMITIQWLLDHHPGNSTTDANLLDSLQMLQSLTPTKWDTWYDPSTYPSSFDYQPSDDQWRYVHGVNAAEGLKAQAVQSRFSNDTSLVQRSMDASTLTFQYHGSPSYSILADEGMRDASPYMGSETCTAVETGFSMSYNYHMLGDNYYADRAEGVIFNALPGALTGTHPHDTGYWAHQYMTQPNGPNAAIGSTQDVFTTSNANAASYGMETDYPCCTVNHPQGWPKFLTQSWGTVGGDGLAHVLLSPSTVSTSLNGGTVSVSVDTNYPFSDTLTYSVDSSVPFTLYLRIPSSASAGGSIVVNGGNDIIPSPDQHTGLHSLSLSAGQSTVVLNLNISYRVETRPSGAVSVLRGNLLYVLYVNSTATTTLPHAAGDEGGAGLDYLGYVSPDLKDTRYNATSAWNVAIDPSTIQYNAPDPNAAIDYPAFGINGVSNSMTVQGCTVAWEYKSGSTTPDLPPQSPQCVGNMTQYTLVPYGVSKVHMSELPVISGKSIPS